MSADRRLPLQSKFHPLYAASSQSQRSSGSQHQCPLLRSSIRYHHGLPPHYCGHSRRFRHTVRSWSNSFVPGCPSEHIRLNVDCRSDLHLLCDIRHTSFSSLLSLFSDCVLWSGISGRGYPLRNRGNRRTHRNVQKSPYHIPGTC